MADRAFSLFITVVRAIGHRVNNALQRLGSTRFCDVAGLFGAIVSAAESDHS